MSTHPAILSGPSTDPRLQLLAMPHEIRTKIWEFVLVKKVRSTGRRWNIILNFGIHPGDPTVATDIRNPMAPPSPNSEAFLRGHRDNAIRLNPPSGSTDYDIALATYKHASRKGSAMSAIGPKDAVSLLRVCRQTHLEGSVCLYSKNTFITCSSLLFFAIFVDRTIGKQNAAYIRDVRFLMPWTPTPRNEIALNLMRTPISTQLIGLRHLEMRACAQSTLCDRCLVLLGPTIQAQLRAAAQITQHHPILKKAIHCGYRLGNWPFGALQDKPPKDPSEMVGFVIHLVPEGGDITAFRPNPDKPSTETPVVEEPFAENPNVEQPSAVIPPVEEPSAQNPNVEQPSPVPPPVEELSPKTPPPEYKVCFSSRSHPRSLRFAVAYLANVKN